MGYDVMRQAEALKKSFAQMEEATFELMAEMMQEVLSEDNYLDDGTSEFERRKIRLMRERANQYCLTLAEEDLIKMVSAFKGIPYGVKEAVLDKLREWVTVEIDEGSGVMKRDDAQSEILNNALHYIVSALSVTYEEKMSAGWQNVSEGLDGIERY